MPLPGSPFSVFTPAASDAGRTGRGLRALVLAVAPAAAVGGVALVGGAQVPAAIAAAAITLAVGAVAASRPAGAAAAAAVDPRSQSLSLSDQPIAPIEALEALPYPVMLVEAGDPDDFSAQRILFANRAARDFLRIPQEGSLLVSAMRRPEVLEAVEASLFGGEEASTNFETGGAQDRFWRVWTRPIPRPGSAKRFALLVMRDETDARRNERMRADFLANASHELRTPLASLAGFIETLRGHAKDDPAARDRFLRIMAGQADRMGRLIEDLLSLSRIELNEHIPPAGDCDLSLAVADVADAVGLLVRDKGVQLELALAPRGSAVVVGDRDQILQVIQNLLDNAVKYAPAGSAVKVEVAVGLGLDRAQAADAPGLRAATAGWARLPLLTPDRSEGERYALIKVIDAGSGIDREHLPRLAERFYRVEGQKSGERSGTGLGLAIVKHIINRHRGGLTVESALGQGSAFSAYFPLSGAARATGDEPPAGAVSAAPATDDQLATVTKLS